MYADARVKPESTVTGLDNPPDSSEPKKLPSIVSASTFLLSRARI